MDNPYISALKCAIETVVYLKLYIAFSSMKCHTYCYTPIVWNEFLKRSFLQVHRWGVNRRCMRENGNNVALLKAVKGIIYYTMHSVGRSVLGIDTTVYWEIMLPRSAQFVYMDPHSMQVETGECRILGVVTFFCRGINHTSRHFTSRHELCVFCIHPQWHKHWFDVSLTWKFKIIIPFSNRLWNFIRFWAICLNLETVERKIGHCHQCHGCLISCCSAPQCCAEVLFCGPICAAIMYVFKFAYERPMHSMTHNCLQIPRKFRIDGF